MTQRPIPLPPSVNYHLWQPCNMRCRFCFAAFDDVKASVLPKGHLPEPQAALVVERLSERFEKITFAGGEPTLCPWLWGLMERARRSGAITMLVTNGSMIDDAWLYRYAGVLDWLTLSVDSAVPETNARMGRAVSGRAIAAGRYREMASGARARGIRVKVNTVVTSHNHGEDMRAFIRDLAPERWKVLQALPVATSPLPLTGSGALAADGLCRNGSLVEGHVGRGGAAPLTLSCSAGQAASTYAHFLANSRGLPNEWS